MQGEGNLFSTYIILLKPTRVMRQRRVLETLQCVQKIDRNRETHSEISTFFAKINNFTSSCRSFPSGTHRLQAPR